MKGNDLLFRAFFAHPMSIIRICTGIGFIIQGLNVLNADYMAGHIAIFEGQHGLPMSNGLAYISKGGELLLGVMLLLGLYTRIAALILIINMLVATFIALGGDILSTENYQAQLSWIYVIIGFAIFVSAPTRWSMDEKLSKGKN